MLRNIREMQGGIARALIRARRRHDGIAILHSRRSGAFSRLVKILSAVESSQVGFQKLIEDLGMQYRYTWTKEVEAGVLRSGEFRVLVLPYAQILSPKEQSEIRRFVRNGGTVVADLRVATHDRHGRPLARGGLDDLLGIRSSGAAIRPVKGRLTWATGVSGAPLAKPVAVPGFRADASVRVDGGKALAQLGDASAVVVRRAGKGHAVLLNHALSTYRTLLNRGQDRTIRGPYRSLFALGGSRRRFAVVGRDGADIPGAELAVFQNGPIEYLTLQKHAYEHEKYPVGGVIRLDGPRWVTNTRTGKSLGRTDRIDVALTGLGCYVFTLLPYEVKQFQVSVPRTARRGTDAAVEVAVVAAGREPGPHTIRVDVFDPSGKRLWPRVKLETHKGKARVVLPIAINDRLGNWKVVVTDVTTGRTRHGMMKVTQ